MTHHTLTLDQEPTVEVVNAEGIPNPSLLDELVF